MPALLCHLIAVVIFVLRSADETVLRSYFGRLDVPGQVEFLTFLEALLVVILTSEAGNTILGPADWAVIETAERETAILNDIARKASSISYPLFFEMSKRLIRFIWLILDSDNLQLDPLVLSAFGSLFKQLLGPHQHEANFSPIILTLSKFCEVHSHLFYYTISPAYQELIATSLGLITRRHRSARAAGVALVAHFLFSDFVATNSIVSTSSTLLNGLISRLGSIAPFKLPLFETFIESLRIFLCAYRFPHFVELVRELVAAAFAVWNSGAQLRGSNQSPEHRVHHLQQQADHCFGYPVLRLRLLREIENTNQTKGLFVQAYIARLQICSLVETVVKFLGKERLPPLDFSFHPVALQEHKFDLSHCKPDLQRLLTLDPAFSLNGLIAEFRAAIDLATRARLYWHARYCRFLLITIFQLRRDSEQLAVAMPGLADSYLQIQNADEPVRFFLVVQKRSGKLVSRSIFASIHSGLPAFCEWLMQSDQRRFESSGVARQFKNFDDLVGGPQDVIGVTEVFSTETLISNYLTQTFSQLIRYETVSWDEIEEKELLFTTESPHPATYVALPVIDVKEKTLTKWEKLIHETRKIQEKLVLTSSRCFLMFPQESIAEALKRYGVQTNMTPLIKELQAALRNPVIKGLAEGIGIQGERGERAKIASEELLKEIEIGLRNALWFQTRQEVGGGQQDPEFMKGFTQVAAIKAEATAFAMNVLKKNLNLGQLEMRSDPIGYKLPAGWEDFS